MNTYLSTIDYRALEGSMSTPSWRYTRKLQMLFEGILFVIIIVIDHLTCDVLNHVLECV